MNNQTMSKTGKLGAHPEDFEAHGIKQGAPEIWEDGQRIEKLVPGEYEWWYTDGHFSNGMIAVISFFIMIDEQGNRIPQVNLNIANQEKVIVDQIVNYQADEFSAAKERCAVTIGSNYFRTVDGLTTYEIFVDPETNNDFGSPP